MSLNIKHHRPVIIGVTGGSGSGKTTVSNSILNQLHTYSLAMIQEDSYYKKQDNIPISERKKINYDHPNALDTNLLVDHLYKLLNWKSIDIPIYDYSIHNRSKKVIHQEPKEVILVEGILVLNDYTLRNLMDIKIFVDTDDDIRLIRRIQRDMKERGRSLQSIIDQYLETVKPMYHQFIEPTKRYADIIVPEGGQNHVAIDLLVTKIKDIILKNNKFN